MVRVVVTCWCPPTVLMASIISLFLRLLPGTEWKKGLSTMQISHVQDSKGRRSLSSISHLSKEYTPQHAWAKGRYSVQHLTPHYLLCWHLALDHLKMKQHSLKLIQKMNRCCCISGISLIVLISFFLISFFPLFFYLFIWFVIVLTFLSATKK